MEFSACPGVKTTHTMRDLVDEIRVLFDIDEKTEFNFSLLVEKNPIEHKYGYYCKLLAITVKIGETKKTIFIDKLNENNIKNVSVKETYQRKMKSKSTPFFIDGNSTVKQYKNNGYIEYSFREPNRILFRLIAKLREKFNVPEPRIFKGKALELEFDDLI
jgi:hypothetical protein